MVAELLAGDALHLLDVFHDLGKDAVIDLLAVLIILGAGLRGNVFFFKQKTAYEMRMGDWSSDVCSSDLTAALPVVTHYKLYEAALHKIFSDNFRSEERRVGKECRSRWSPYH